MTKLIEQVFKYDSDNEEEATQHVNYYKDKQYSEGYTVKKYDISYKVKKDRSTGEIIEEHWVATIVVDYNTDMKVGE